MAVDFHCIFRREALWPPHQHHEHLINHFIVVLNIPVVDRVRCLILQMHSAAFGTVNAVRYCDRIRSADPDDPDPGA